MAGLHLHRISLDDPCRNSPTIRAAAGSKIPSPSAEQRRPLFEINRAAAARLGLAREPLVVIFLRVHVQTTVGHARMAEAAKLGAIDLIHSHLGRGEVQR